MLVDAEQSYFQTAIHHFTVRYLMPTFNGCSPVVYNTLQTYLTVPDYGFLHANIITMPDQWTKTDGALIASAMEEACITHSSDVAERNVNMTEP